MSLSGNLELQARLPAPDRRLAGRQLLTVALLFAGYASYYFCRADFSVAMPMLIDELHRHGSPRGIATVHLGAVVSFGVLAYAAGKFLLGGLGDLWGGRRSLITGLSGAIAFTLLFTLRRRIAHFQRGLDRQPFGSVHGLGRGRQSVFEVVFLPVLRNRYRHLEP